MEPWSKKIWYIEGLILLLMIFLGVYSNIVVMIILTVISVIVVGITSISLKKSENKRLDVKPVLNTSNSISQQHITNANEVMGEEEHYHSLRNMLNIPAPSSSLNAQQITPITASHSSTIQIEDVAQAKYVIFEGVRYRVRSKSLKLHNKLINNITDIQGLKNIWRLRKLDLSHNQIISMKGVEFLPNLRILKLSDNKIQKIENIKNFHRLKKLILDNNQLKELNSAELPNTLTHINIAKNPIEKFTIYTKVTYNKIHFGSKKWFPEQEIKRLKRQMHRLSKSYKSYDIKGGFLIFLLVFGLWAGITFGIALLINLIIWGALGHYGGMYFNFWEFLFAGEWTAGLFLAAGILSAIGMAILYYEMK